MMLCIVVLAGEATMVRCCRKCGSGCPWVRLNRFLVRSPCPSVLKVWCSVFLLVLLRRLIMSRNLLCVLHRFICVCVSMRRLLIGWKCRHAVCRWNTV